MRGTPNVFSTKQDYLNCFQILEFREKTIEEFKKLLNDRMVFQETEEYYQIEDFTDEIKKKIEEDNTKKIIEDYDKNDRQKLLGYKILSLKEDKFAKMFRLGFTVEELENYINS